MTSIETPHKPRRPTPRSHFVEVAWGSILDNWDGKTFLSQIFFDCAMNSTPQGYMDPPRLPVEMFDGSEDLVLQVGAQLSLVLRDLDGQIWKFFTAPFEPEAHAIGLDLADLIPRVTTKQLENLDQLILVECAQALSGITDPTTVEGMVFPYGDEDWYGIIRTPDGVRQVEFTLPEDDLLAWYSIHVHLVEGVE